MSTLMIDTACQITDGIYTHGMQAEKVLAMVAKEAHAAGILSVQRTEPQLELVAAITGGAAQMTMHRRLAHHVSDSKD